MDKNKPYTVSDLNHIAQKTLENNFADIWVEGEISNYRGVSSSGHCYFCLKDAAAQIDAVAFRGVMNSLRFKLEDGLKVLMLGRVTLYAQRGSYQIVAAAIEPQGAGALQLAFEQLKKKLEAEGLFDPERKKPIPELPQKIGIVTSPTGAALKDILTVIDRRFANVHILIYPVKVQGEDAKNEIAAAVRYLNAHHPDLDVLLVGRGGGSIEDLWAFNEEIVARAIADSDIPVISCVGHEIDFTIADFVADLRAPTPSAAAELVVKNKMEIRASIDGLYARLQQNVLSSINFLSEKLNGLRRSNALSRPGEFFEKHSQNLDDLMDRSGRALASHLERNQNLLNLAAGRLEALSPLAVLSRGYSIAWLEPEQQILKSASQAAQGDSILLRLHEGKIRATIQETIRS
jgi:exodeoxyribonuclease VII large subunit